jgi:hypothetical protein
MSYEQILFSATIEWMQHRGVDVVNELDRRFVNTLEFRPLTVTDFRGHSVSSVEERLVRWDRRSPNDIFATGFEPIVTPQSYGEFLALPDSAVNVATYVDTNVDSIFVSAARFYSMDGRATRWTPRNLANIFEYEIFAPGGIDVNLSMGRFHRYWNQREVLFPGGIRPAYIRTAREYDAQGRIVRLWANGGFDITNTPAWDEATHPSIAHLPNPVCGPSVNIRYWTGSDEASEARDKRASPDDSDDIMRGEGDAMVPDDAMYGVASYQDWHVTRSCLLIPNQPQNGIISWFFADTCFARIQRFPGTDNTGDKILEGPMPIMDGWPELRRAGFAKVNAAWPRSDNPNKIYFFFGGKYILADISSHSILEGPTDFSSNWPSLKDTGFSSLDAALPVGDNDVHVFKADSYAVIRREREVEAVTGPYKIADKWAGLRDAHFTDHIDAAVWQLKRDVYYFRDGEYIVMNIDSEAKEYGPTQVSQRWPILTRALFY